MPNPPSNVGAQLQAAVDDARAGLTVLDALIGTVLLADDCRPAEELARLKREAEAYRQAGLKAAQS